MTISASRILVVNGKGGCGKTTIATNLAAMYAVKGYSVALIDHDPQAASTDWSKERDGSLPPVRVIAAHQRSNMYQTQTFHNRIPADTQRIVVDAHSASRDQDLQLLLKNVDVVLVPLLPSSFDIRAGGRFIAELLTHRAFRQFPRPVGVIANRVQPNTPSQEQLNHFLRCLDVPCVATFRDSPVYSDAALEGSSVADMRSCRAARKEAPQWHALVDWLESQPTSVTTTVQSLRQRALRADRHDDEDAGAQPQLSA